MRAPSASILRDHEDDILRPLLRAGADLVGCRSCLRARPAAEAGAAGFNRSRRLAFPAAEHPPDRMTRPTVRAKTRILRMPLGSRTRRTSASVTRPSWTAGFWSSPRNWAGRSC